MFRKYSTQVDRSLIVFWILSCFRKSTKSKKLRNTEQSQENGQLKYSKYDSDLLIS